MCARRLDERTCGRGAGRADPGRPAGRRTRAWQSSGRRPPTATGRTPWCAPVPGSASALVREEAGDRGGVLRACGRGLAALDEHRRTLGSSELRALATAHGRELAVLALRHAATDARTLLRWSERWRATALAEPPVTPDGEVSTELAALRDNGRRLAQARAEGEPTEQLETERARLERAVRAEHHRRAGGQEARRRAARRRPARRRGRAGTLVELVHVDGTLHVLVVHDGQVRRRVAGSTDEAPVLADHARSALRRAAHGRPYAPGDLGTAAAGGAARIGRGPVAGRPGHLVPTGRLHAAPWSLLPTLADRAFDVVPSAAQWLRAREVRPPADAERAAAGRAGARQWRGRGAGAGRRTSRRDAARGVDATVEHAMAGLDGATWRTSRRTGASAPDSPLFSSLEMADGPLTVHDLERLQVAPYRLVLSACESGVLAPVGADELLGLASALFSIGTAGLVCSIAEVNDDATAALMLDLHDHLASDPEGGSRRASARARAGRRDVAALWADPTLSRRLAVGSRSVPRCGDSGVHAALGADGHGQVLVAAQHPRPAPDRRPAGVRSGKRSNSRCSATSPSSRASAAPRQ